MWWILLEFELQIFKDNAMVHVTLGLSWTSRQFGVQSPEPRPHVSVLCGICGPCTWDLGSRRGWKETEAAHWFLTDLHPVHAWESCSTVTTSQHGWHSGPVLGPAKLLESSGSYPSGHQPPVPAMWKEATLHLIQSVSWSHSQCPEHAKLRT